MRLALLASALVCPKFSTAKTVTAFRFRTEVCSKPHPEKLPLGEDGYFMSPKCIAVADGVGGWRNEGVDPGPHARELCSELGTLIQDNSIADAPRQLFIRSARKNKQRGSSTFSVLTIDKMLKYAYLGDSIFLVLRKGDIVLEAPMLEVYPNCPKQIGEFGNNPEEAQEKSFEVQEGDVVVLATDGLWDNLSKKQIAEQCKVKPSAEGLGKAAFERAHDLGALFNRAKRQGQGGKPDDITILVALVEKQ